MQHELDPGFEDPVHDAQQTFRAVLDAMAEPGLVRRLPSDITSAPGISAAATAILLTLSDSDTPMWLAPSVDTARLRQHFAFHTGCPFTDDPAAARFIVCRPGEEPDLACMACGTSEFPDRSATLLLDCPSLAAGGSSVELQGPGIQGTRSVSLAALDDRFWTMAAGNHARYPLGIDFILCAERWTMALPRSTRISMEA